MKWPTISIGRVCLATEQRDPTRTPAERFRYIDIAAIDRVSKRIDGAPEVLGADAPSRARKAVRSGDVLVSTVRPNLNAVAIVPPELDGQIASTGFCVLRADPQVVSNRYIFYRCITSEFVHSLVGHMRGANYPAVSDSVVKQSALPLPPICEQNRIVAILDQADTLRQKRAQADALEDRILPALFHSLFGNPAANTKHWARKPLGQLLENIDSGWSPICENRPATLEEWGVLKLGAVTGNHYQDQENKALPSSEKPEPTLEVLPGDLLMSRKNTRELVGACAYVHTTRPRLMLSDLVFRLRLKPTKEVHPLYLWGLLTCPTKRPLIQALAGGSAGSMPNISKSRLETLPIELPPPHVQQLFVSAVTALHSLRTQTAAATQRINDLFAVLLHRAFTGGLTAKWREVHTEELLAEMEQQARLLNLPSPERN